MRPRQAAQQLAASALHGAPLSACPVYHTPPLGLAALVWAAKVALGLPSESAPATSRIK